MYISRYVLSFWFHNLTSFILYPLRLNRTSPTTIISSIPTAAPTPISASAPAEIPADGCGVASLVGMAVIEDDEEAEAVEVMLVKDCDDGVDEAVLVVDKNPVKVKYVTRREGAGARKKSSDGDPMQCGVSDEDSPQHLHSLALESHTTSGRNSCPFKKKAMSVVKFG
jgi:hypothetical protein